MLYMFILKTLFYIPREFLGYEYPENRKQLLKSTKLKRRSLNSNEIYYRGFEKK